MSSRMGGLVGEGEGSWFNFDIKLIFKSSLQECQRFLRNWKSFFVKELCRFEVRENTRKIDKQCNIFKV